MKPVAHFKKIKSEKKSTQLAEQIIEAIQNGVYQPGDRIPSERTIAEETGISRPSVREAMSALQIAGIVESKGGSGCYAKEIVHESLTLNVLSMLEKTIGPFEMLEARKTVEPAVARLAANKATSQHLELIRGALLQMRKAAKLVDAKSFDSADHDFHIAIAVATGNNAIKKVVQYLLRPMIGKIWRQIKLEKDSMQHTEHVDVVIKSHERILEAIEEKKAQVAENEMIEHIKFSEKNMFEAEGTIENGTK